MEDLAAGNPRAVATRIQSDEGGRAGGQRKHDLRHAPIPGYVNQERMHLNSVIVQPMTPGALRKICQERRELRDTKRAMKSNASVAISGIIVFGREVQADFEALSIEQQDMAFRDVAEAVAARLNSTVTGLVAHRDETAPHAHFQLPAYDLNGNAISAMTKRGVTSELQTITAEVMKRHVASAERGRSKYDRLRAGAEFSDTVHRSVAELHHDLGPEIAAALSKRSGLEEEAETLAKRVAKLREKEELAAREVKRLQTYERRLASKQEELDALQSELLRLEDAANQERDFIDDAAAVADEKWNSATAALEALSATEERRKAVEGEATQIRETALREAQSAADALLARSEDEAVQTARRVTEKTSRRLEKVLLDDGQKALLKVERERDQWRSGFETLRDTAKKVIPEGLYQTLRARFMDLWGQHPDNPDRKPEPPRASYSSGPSGP